MKRILTLTALILAAITLSACDTLHDLVKVPPTDYTGTYAALDVDYGSVCGAPRKGEVHLNINTTVVEDASLHNLKLDAIIFDAGPGGETLASTAEWTVNGNAKTLNSGAINNFGTVSLKKDGPAFTGTFTIFNLECATPATEPGQPDHITYARITVPFTTNNH